MLQLLSYLQKRDQLWVSCGIFALCVTSFLIAFPISWVRYALGIFLIFSFICWFADYRTSFSYLKQNWFLILPFAGYFFLHLFYSFTGGFEWSYIEKRLMFLLIPLIGIAVLGSDQFQTKKMLFIKTFILGLFAALSVLLIRGLLIKFNILEEPVLPVNSINWADSRFLPTVLTFFQHPAYLSMELNFAVVLLIVFAEELDIPKQIRYFLIVFFLVGIYLISSRAGLLSTFVSVTFLLGVRLRRLCSGRIFYLLLPGIVILLFILTVLINPRISTSLSNIRERIKKNESVNLIDLEPRTRVWFSSAQLIIKHPLTGIGAKNFDRELVAEYRKNGFYAEAFFNLNAHNQFLETQLAFGITGSFLLIWMLLAPFFHRKRIVNFILFKAFLIIIIINFMFESMLVRQWGILFFILFCFFQVRPVSLTDDQGSKSIS